MFGLLSLVFALAGPALAADTAPPTTVEAAVLGSVGDPAAFQKATAALLRENLGVTVTIPDDTFQLRSEAGHIYNLGRLYTALQHDEGDLLELLRNWVGASELAEGDARQDKSWDQVQPALRPMVRTAILADHAELVIAPQSPTEGAGLAWKPLGDHLITVLAVDYPTAVTMVTQDQLDTWGVSFDEALAVAVDNLRDASPSPAFQEIDDLDGVWMSGAGDYYDSSRLFLTEELGKLPLGGDPVVQPASPSFLLVTGSSDVRGLLSTTFVLTKSEEDASFQSAALLVLGDDGWEDFPRPGDSVPLPISQMALGADCADHSARGEVLSHSLGDGTPVARCDVIPLDGDELTTASPWEAGDVPVLLPPVQHYALRRDDEVMLVPHSAGHPLLSEVHTGEELPREGWLRVQGPVSDDLWGRLGEVAVVRHQVPSQAELDQQVSDAPSSTDLSALEPSSASPLPPGTRVRIPHGMLPGTQGKAWTCVARDRPGIPADRCELITEYDIKVVADGGRWFLTDQRKLQTADASRGPMMGAVFGGIVLDWACDARLSGKGRVKELDIEGCAAELHRAAEAAGVSADDLDRAYLGEDRFRLQLATIGAHEAHGNGLRDWKLRSGTPEILHQYGTQISRSVRGSVPCGVAEAGSCLLIEQQILADVSQAVSELVPEMLGESLPANTAYARQRIVVEKDRGLPVLKDMRTDATGPDGKSIMALRVITVYSWPGLDQAPPSWTLLGE